MERPAEEILVKYFRGELEGSELKIVELYLAMEIDEEYVKQGMKTAAAQIEETVNPLWTEARHLAAWEKFTLRKSVQEPELIRSIPLWKRLSVAAAVFLCISAVALYLMRPESADQYADPRTARLVEDLAPGSNKAVLILADGKQIDINSAKNGQLALQGQTAVIKTDDGKLLYQDAASPENTLNAALNTLVVPKGGQYNLTLPDGTKVWLNAASSLIFPARFSGNVREVSLKGEAYFEVAKNEKMPFHVRLDRMDVEVLGTHFNVMAYDDEPAIKTTLLEGSVKLSNGKSQKILKPGQEGVLGVTDHFVVRTANMEQAMAWKNGLFIFDDEDMPSIARKLSRWYNVSVADERKDKTLTYTGSISKHQYVSEVLKMLELTGTLHYKIENKRVTITDHKN